MRSIVNLFFLFLYCRLVATTPLFENGVNPKTHNFEKHNVNNPILPNSAHNSFRLPDNRRYHPNDPNYQSPANYNFGNYYNNYQPPNSPHFPQVPLRHHAQYPKPPPYNILNSYNSGPLSRPMNILPVDKQRHVLNKVKPTYPIGNKNFEEKQHEILVKPPSDVRNIISKPLIRNHYLSNQKKYMIIYPNGTVDDVDYVEPSVTEHSDYVLVNGADIIPIKNGSPVQIFEHESHTSSDLNSAPVLLDYPENQQESPKPKAQVIIEGSVDNKYQNNNFTVASSNKVSDSNSLINNVPTTIIEIDPQFNPSSDKNVTKIQPEEEVNTKSSIKEDIIKNATLFEGQNTKPIENATEEIDLQKNKFTDKVLVIEDDTSNILDKSIILTNNTDITLLNSEQEHLIDEVPLLLDINKGTNEKSNNNTNLFMEGHNETSNQFKERKDSIINLLPTENSLENVKNNNLLTKKESKSTTTVAWGNTSNNTGENYGKEFSDLNISPTLTADDISNASVTTPRLENGLHTKIYGLQNFNLNNAKLPKLAHNSFYIPGNRRYYHNYPNYQSPPNYNFPNYYNNYRPPNLPYFPQVPSSHHVQYPRPPLYNILNSYNSASLSRPMNNLPIDKQIHVLDEVKPVYPNENIKFEEKLHESIVEPPSDIRNTISKPIIRNHLDHKMYTSILKSVPQLHLNPLGNEYEAQTLKIQLNGEGPVYNRFQNNHDFVIDSPHKVYNTLTDTLSKNTPTTIIEMEPQFITSSNSNVTETQQEEAENTTSPIDEDIIRSEDFIEESSKETSPDHSTKLPDELPNLDSEPEATISFDPFIDFEDDITSDTFDQLRKNIAKPLEENVSSDDIKTITRLADDFRDLFITSQINETKANENATEEIYLDKNKIINNVPNIEDDTDGILGKPTILTNDTNNASLNFEQEHLFDEVHFPLETNKESTFYDNARSSIHNESLTINFHNETFNQFREIKDLPVNLLTVENPAEIVNNYGLSADKETHDPKSSTSVAWSRTLNDNYGNESSGVNISSTHVGSTTVGDISVATDNITPSATEERPIYFKIDKDFWEKLRHKEIPFDVVYFFQVEEPVIKKDVQTITYPNGTVVTHETLHEVEEDNGPILIKNIDID